MSGEETPWTPETLAAELLKSSRQINDNFDNSPMRGTLEAQVLLLREQLANLSWGVGRILVMLSSNAISTAPMCERTAARNKHE